MGYLYVNIYNKSTSSLLTTRSVYFSSLGQNLSTVINMDDFASLNGVYKGISMTSAGGNIESLTRENINGSYPNINVVFKVPTSFRGFQSPSDFSRYGGKAQLLLSINGTASSSFDFINYINYGNFYTIQQCNINLNLYADFTPTNVKFLVCDKDGETYTESDMLFGSVNNYNGANYKLPTAYELTTTGYVLDYYKDSFFGYMYSNTTSIPFRYYFVLGINNIVKIYSYWKAKTFNLSFYNKNKVVNTQLIAYDSSISSYVPSRKGFIFNGWSLNSNCSTIDYQPEDIWVTDGIDGSDLKLYAVWEYDPTFKRNFSKLPSGKHVLSNLDVGPFADNTQFLNSDDVGVIETTEYYHIAKTFRDNSDSADTQELSAVESYDNSETGTKILDEEVTMKNGSLNVKSLSFGDKAIMKYDTDEHAMRISFKKDYDFKFINSSYNSEITDAIWSTRILNTDGTISETIPDGVIFDIVKDETNYILYVTIQKSFIGGVDESSILLDYYSQIESKEYIVKTIETNEDYGNDSYGIYNFSIKLQSLFDSYNEIIVYIPNSIETLGNYTFCGHNNKWHFVFEENSKLKTLKDSTFYVYDGDNGYSENLIELPNTITNISMNALYGCNIQYTGPLLDVAEENNYWGAYKFNGVLTGNF